MESKFKNFDEDGDKIFESLKARMITASPNEELPVIILYKETTPSPGTYSARLAVSVPGKKSKIVFKTIPAVAASLSRSEIEKVQKDPWVDHIELDAQVHICMDTAKWWFGVTSAQDQFGFTGDLDNIRGNYSGNDVVVAVIDSGINSQHPDLAGKVIGWHDYVNGQSQPYDDNGHGTHVAGVIAGTGSVNSKLRGVAYEAALVGLKVVGADGTGPTSVIAQAVDDVIANRGQFNIRILNMSIAGSGSSNGKDALALVCNRAVSSGITVVVAAGNDGPEARTISSPAAANSVITVGAGADIGEFGFYLAEFSSRGPTADGRTKPDLWGPGVNVRSPAGNSGYSDVDGTSFAAPFVSGVVALMLDANPGLRPATIKSILTSTAMKWGPNRNNEAGFGRLQAYQAIARAAGITRNLNPPKVPTEGFAQTNISSGQNHDYQVHLGNDYWPAITLITLDFPNADLDLELLDSSGNVKCKSASSSRQERISATFPSTCFPPEGDYTVRVKSFRGNSRYLMNLSADWSQ